MINFLYWLLDKLAYFKVTQNHFDAKLPVKADSGSAGYDIFSIEHREIPQGERQLVNTGISVEIPRAFYLRCAPRSGLSCKGIDVGAGVIDSSYRGDIKVLVINNSSETFIVNRGDKIAQLIMERCANVQPVNVLKLSETERGSGSFGSTDKTPEYNEHKVDEEFEMY